MMISMAWSGDLEDEPNFKIVFALVDETLKTIAKTDRNSSQMPA